MRLFLFGIFGCCRMMTSLPRTGSILTPALLPNSRSRCCSQNSARSSLATNTFQASSMYESHQILLIQISLNLKLGVCVHSLHTADISCQLFSEASARVQLIAVTLASRPCSLYKLERGLWCTHVIYLASPAIYKFLSKHSIISSVPSQYWYVNDPTVRPNIWSVELNPDLRHSIIREKRTELSQRFPLICTKTQLEPGHVPVAPCYTSGW